MPRGSPCLGSFRRSLPSIARASSEPSRFFWPYVSLHPVAPTGCRASFSPSPLAPTDTSRVTMLVATTRKPSQDPGKLYSGDRGTAISLNSVDGVDTIPTATARSGRCSGLSRMPPNPEKEFAATAGRQSPVRKSKAFDWYRQEPKLQASGHHFRSWI